MSAYTVYADEAWTHDPDMRFWRFYGGAMLPSRLRTDLENELSELKDELGLQGEMKWSYTRPFNWERYARVVDLFLDSVEDRRVKLRYMWLDQLFQNPNALTAYQREYGYYILYYFFIVFAFGPPWHDVGSVEVEALLDAFPDTPEKRFNFRQFMLSCHQFQRFENCSTFRIFDVGHVDSHEHIIVQCVDVIIGAMGFRLNRMHQVKQSNGRRADATKAKEKLYKRIRDRLGQIDMGERGGSAFGVGVSTSRGSDYSNLWRHKFRQWSFKKPGVLDPRWVRRPHRR